MKNLPLIKRRLKVQTTNDKILQVYLRENNDANDGIYFDVLVKNTLLPNPPGSEVVGTNIIQKSMVFPGEDVKGIILDTNHIDNPAGYIISLCFFRLDGTTSKLYMGRVNSGGGIVTWTQCADSPKTYANSEILEVFSSFLTVGVGGATETPVKIINIKNPGGQSVIIEHH